MQGENKNFSLPGGQTQMTKTSSNLRVEETFAYFA